MASDGEAEAWPDFVAPPPAASPETSSAPSLPSPSTSALGGLPSPASAVPLSCTDCDNCQYDRLWPSLPPREEAKGIAGVVVQRLGLAAYVLFVVVPFLYTVVVHAVIPIGDPKVPSFRSQWVFFLITNPLAFALFTFLYTAAFLSAAERERPFRQHWLPFVAVLLVQIAFYAPVLVYSGTFDYSGLVSISLFFLSLYVALRVSYPEHSAECEVFFRTFILVS